MGTHMRHSTGRQTVGMATALLRPVPDTLPDCLTLSGRRPGIDLRLARRQHRAYRRALEEAGLGVELLPVDHRHPDSCFVEDTLVVLGRIGVLTRPGAPSRRGEVEGVGAALAGRMPLRRVPAPATLEGGDVLRIGRRVLVGLSGRTNPAGFRWLAGVARSEGLEATAVPVERGALHLKSAATALDPETVLVAEGALPLESLRGLRMIPVPAGEAPAANALRAGEVVLVAEGHPRTLERVSAAGFAVRPVDVSEFVKADAGLTCLSVLLDEG